MGLETISPAAVPQALASRAAASVEAVIEEGVARLIAEPWRVSRIIRGAEELTLEQLRTKVVWRRALPPRTDFNRALALAQLARALDTPSFAAIWSTERTRSNAAAPQILPAVIA